MRDDITLDNNFPTECALCGEMIDSYKNASVFPKVGLFTHETCFKELVNHLVEEPYRPQLIEELHVLGMAEIFGYEVPEFEEKENAPVNAVH